MENSRFTEIDEEFVCDVCKSIVKKLEYSARDHCPYCLCSKHLDINPGDRSANCGGVLKPIDIEKGKKDNYKIVCATYKDGEIYLDEVLGEDKLKSILPMFVKEF